MSELEPPVPRKERRAHKRPLPLPEVKFVPAGNPSLPTFVSLMLMITTFMIVLTSISLHENTRMHELMSGVKATFALGKEDQRPSEGEILGAAAAGFRAALPLAEVAGESGGNNLVLTLPITSAIDTTGKATTRELEDGLAALAKALVNLPQDTGYEVELRFADRDFSNEYAGVLAAAAMNRGVPPARFFIGNGAGDKANITLLLKLAPPQPDFVTPAATETP